MLDPALWVRGWGVYEIEFEMGGQRTRPLSTAALGVAQATGTWLVVDLR